METIKEAKEYLRNNYKKGVACPCCNQMVKLYKRPMHLAMALALIKLYKISKEKNLVFFHKRDFILDVSWGDFAKLEHWGLVEEKLKDDRDRSKKTSGYWKITEKGEEFVKGTLAVPSHVILYNKKPRGFTGKDITIKDVLKKEFNYEELMALTEKEIVEETDRAILKKTQLPKPVGGVSFTVIRQDFCVAFGSDGKKYTVKKTNGLWLCGCEAYRYSKDGKCKHTLAITKHFLEVDKKAKDELQGKLI